CGCSLCYRDRIQFDCTHPGECIETAKILIDSLFAKWNPTIPNPDLCNELSLTEEELQLNKGPLEHDQIMVYDPNFSLSNMGDGFRIFAFDDP
ncbi:hypothetical protein C8R44DRAFT_550964, partial [Mycena epipterygia]